MTTSGQERLQADIRWFIENLDEVPGRLHRRGVWADPDTGLGSVIGSPDLHPTFARWLEAAESAKRTERQEVPCPHPGMTESDRAAGRLCMACASFDANGRPMTESGRIIRTRTIYRWPMRAAMARVRRIPVRSGRPDFALTLLTYARARANAADAASLLASRFPAMGDEAVFMAHLADALRRVRHLYRLDPPNRLLPRTPVDDKSDAQANAEAAA